MYFLVILSVFILLAEDINADKPCASRPVRGESVVCVCNATYCDEVVRKPPPIGKYVIYTSSEDGQRFNKTVKDLKNVIESSCCSTTIDIDPGLRYQVIEGFGGAVTDAAGIHWKNLSKPLQDYLINSYFGDTGLQYSMLRVPIGSSDFSTHPYAYNEIPENDTMLTNYTLAFEDFEYKIPMIKAIMEASSTPIHIVATTWTPPPWMKTNDKYTGRNRLKPEFYQTYALYHYKFLEKYSEQGIPIWGITTTNEPVNGLTLGFISCLGFTPADMGKWIVNNLGPMIRNSVFKDIKIMTLDDQRYAIPLWFNVMTAQHPNAISYIDGVAIHYYGDFITPASVLLEVGKRHPGMFVLATEACEGSFPWQFEKVLLGSWKRAKNYILDIIEDLNHNVIGWLDWNLCLDKNGGPNWSKNYVDSPVIVFPENDEFVKQPMFYAMGHFSKFVPRGSERIGVNERKPYLASSINNVAFLTPRNTIVVILYNNSGDTRQVAVKIEDQQAEMLLGPHSITTVEFPYP